MPNRWTWLALAGSLLAGSLLAGASEAAAEEAPAGALRLRVNPSGFERPRETLEEKVERRARESDYRFRWICRGCLPGETEPRPGPPAGIEPGGGRPAPSGAASR